MVLSPQKTRFLAVRGGGIKTLLTRKVLADLL
jgi:hypothetical protein